MQGWVGGTPSHSRANPIYLEAEDAVAGRSKASSSGYGSQRGSGGGSLNSRPHAMQRPDLRHVPLPIWPLDKLEDPYNLYSTYSRRPSSVRSNYLVRSQVYQAPSESSFRSGTVRGDRFLHSLLKDPTYGIHSDGYSSRSETGKYLDNFLARHQNYIKQQAKEKAEIKVERPRRRISVTDASEVNYITKEFDYLMRLTDVEDKRSKKRRERDKYSSFRSRSSRDDVRYVSRRSRKARNSGYLESKSRKLGEVNGALSDSDNSLKTIKQNKKKSLVEKVVEEDPKDIVNNIEVGKPDEKSLVKKDPEFYDSLQADPFLLYSHFIAEEEARTQSSSIRDGTRSTSKTLVDGDKSDTALSFKSGALIDPDGKVKELHKDKLIKEPDKSFLNDAEYTFVAEVERDADGNMAKSINQRILEQYNEIREEIQNTSLTGEREDYLRALLQDVAAALEEALDAKKAPQTAHSGILKEARERVAMGLVALRRAGPEELKELSTALARGPPVPVVRAISNFTPRAPSPHARKPSLWQQYYMRAHSIHSLDSAHAVVDPQLRPEAQFTLGAAGERRLAARLEDARKTRRACRLSAAALALLFFLLALVACSLLLSNGRAPFGSMTR